MSDTSVLSRLPFEGELLWAGEGSERGVGSGKAGFAVDYDLLCREWRWSSVEASKLSLVAANPWPVCVGPASGPAAGDHSQAAVLRYGKDGEKRWLTLKSRPIVDEYGNVTGFIEIENEITDCKFAEEKLNKEKLAAEAENLAKSAYLATICHEIRNPVAVMIGMLDLALQTNLTAEQREYLNLMKISSSSLLGLVNNTLDLSKIESGCLDVEVIPFPLRESLGDAVRMLAFEARKKGIELRCEIAPEIPDALLGDPMRLRQIVINLLCNAIKFTERGTVLMRVECECIDDGEVGCRFAIVDSGIGIAKDKQASIFEPFLQAETSTSRRYGGTGLGLTISAQLVKMMKGRIWLESEQGKGSTFFFTAGFSRQDKAVTESRVHDCVELPVRQPAASAACAAAIDYMLAKPATFPLSAVKPRAKLAILLVDDNPLSRRMGQLVLEKEGHRVLPADCGAVALEMLDCERVDLVLMDLQMPEMDGTQTTQAIRHREEISGRHIPIVALTADPLPGVCEYCLQAGMDAYLIKPVQPALLRETIEGLKVVAAEEESEERDCSLTLDRRALLEQVNGDMQLLGEISDLFLQHCDKLMACVLKTMAASDKQGFAYAIHTLLGMFRSLSAIAAQNTAESLQALSIESEHDQAVVIYKQLEKDVKALKMALANLSRETRVGKPEPTQFTPELKGKKSEACSLSPVIKRRPWHRMGRLQRAA